VVAVALTEYLVSANQAFEMYHGLTQGAIASILTKGSDEQKTKYLPKMVSGEWGGTMNLTEAHCGTDLGLLRTKAEPQDDGSYRITGTKIFISSGEHDSLITSYTRPRQARVRRHGEGHLPVHRAQVPRQRRRQPRRAQRRQLRLDRGEDGHPRQFDLSAQL
jgi:alkylation response protein AidB-like acyl-CoA dehydrogenase